MWSTLRSALSVALLVSLTWSVHAGTPGVKDQAGFFKDATAVQKADAQARELQHLYHQDVLIETFAEPPAADRDKMAKDRDRYFDEWAASRQKAADVNVYVLICEKPSRVQIHVGQETLQAAFSKEDIAKLRDVLVAKFKAKQNAAGLSEGLAFLRERFADKLLPAPVVNAVEDHAGYFSADAVKKAAAKIKDINQASKKPITIETLAKLPAGKSDEVKKMSREARNSYFDKLAQDRAVETRADGVFVLICKEPPHIQIALGAETRKKAFTQADQKHLLELLQKEMGRRPDDALVKGVEFIDDKVRANLHVAAKAPVVVPTPTSPTLPTPPTTPKVDVASKTAPTKTTETVTAPTPTTKAEVKEAPTLREKAAHARDVAVQIGETEQTFKLKYVVFGVVGFLGLWIFIGVLRALFGRKPTPPYQPQQSATPQAPTNSPAGNYQGGAHYAPRPAPTNYQAGNYQQGGGYAQPPAYPQNTGGGGGGFMPGLLGGMFGAAAGNWIYDSFSGHRHAAGGGFTPSAQAQPPARTDSGGGYTTAGGDFTSPAAGAGAGGDFDNNAVEERYAGGGGDFGDSGGGSGGKFADAGGGSGGDFADNGGGAGGGDFAAEEPAAGGGDSGAGGDFGDSGGDAGGGSSDSGGSDSGGGDGSGGGDF